MDSRAHEESIGCLVNRFVEERVDGPSPGESDVWTALVGAALFSAAYIVWVLTGGRSSTSEIENAIHSLIDDIAENSEKWISERINKSFDPTGKEKFFSGFGSVVRRWLHAMFNEAIGVVTDRGFHLEAARTHTCYVFLSGALRELAMKRVIEARDIPNLVAKGIEGTEGMARELKGILGVDSDFRRRSQDAK